MSLDNFRDRISAVIAPYLKGYSARIERARLDEKIVRDPIFGFERLRAYESLIIDTPLFQRLRGVFQTSLTYLTYPSAIHTRFEHSLNCMNLASRVLNELVMSQSLDLPNGEHAEVRLAALLHDVGHCIFSHGSEFFYRSFPEFREVKKDAVFNFASPSEAECANYCIVTSKAFRELLWAPLLKRCHRDPRYTYLDSVDLTRVAEMIVGLSPDNRPHRCYQRDIINGPMDVDKLDYLTRDSYFTGVNLSVDIDRLLPSLRATDVENKERNRSEKRLVVDARGVAVVEQLLFARMLLYDSVYHHHKVRAANVLLQSILKRYHAEKVWPTSSNMLTSVTDFLEIDEYDFFGNPYDDNPTLRLDIKRLRNRDLPERALVLSTRGLCDKDSHTAWSFNCSDFTNREDPIAQQNATRYFDSLRKEICDYAVRVGASDLVVDEIAIDIPDPPKMSKLGYETLIQIVTEYVVPLSDLFPFHKVVNNYSAQYKYRTYVFGPERWIDHVAYGAFRAFTDAGIRPNDLSLILAHKHEGMTRELLIHDQVDIPDWRKKYYVPDADARAESGSHK